MNIMLDRWAVRPTRAHEADAGWDLYAPSDKSYRFFNTGESNECLYKKRALVIDTGVHFEIPRGYVGIIKPKSGLNVSHGILCDGVIDSGYTGSVVVKLYGLDEKSQRCVIEPGQKCAQIIFVPLLHVDKLNEVDSFAETDRGSKGFGSTGAF